MRRDTWPFTERLLLDTDFLGTLLVGYAAELKIVFCAALSFIFG